MSGKSYLESHPKIWRMIQFAGGIVALAVADHYLGGEFVKQIIIALGRAGGIEINGG